LRKQTTLRREVATAGIGLHSGRRVNLRLRPAAAGTGIRFRRADLGGTVIPAAPASLDRCAYATNLREGEATVSTVEHLLSALYGRGVDNVEVEVDDAELPILDGSALPFLELLREAGVRDLSEPRRYLEVSRPISLVEQGKEIVVRPSARLEVTYLIDFEHPAIGRQERTVVLDPASYAREVAPARTFTFVRDVEALRHIGLALGGSLTNAVVLDDRRLLNATLRFPDEFVRHKILDLVGDLALLGRPLLGHVMAFRAGHDLHGRLVSALLSRPDAVRLVDRPTEPSVGRGDGTGARTRRQP
jgi:UDP-3-O-[3-hydroxymyristoyl] N-acetylglucosamine deacetylase